MTLGFFTFLFWEVFPNKVVYFEKKQKTARPIYLGLAVIALAYNAIRNHCHEIKFSEQELSQNVLASL